jgi:hypothetical protein
VEPLRYLLRLDTAGFPDDGIIAATMNMLKATWAGAIEARWSNRFGIGRAGEATCPIMFDVEWVTSNPHHILHRHSAPSGASCRHCGGPRSRLLGRYDMLSGAATPWPADIRRI